MLQFYHLVFRSKSNDMNSPRNYSFWPNYCSAWRITSYFRLLLLLKATFTTRIGMENSSSLPACFPSSATSFWISALSCRMLLYSLCRSVMVFLTPSALPSLASCSYI